jgi:hypothetical protein
MKPKPCPFCGELPVVSYSPNGLGWQVACMNEAGCELTPITWLYETEEEAVAAWNKRGREIEN